MSLLLIVLDTVVKFGFVILFACFTRLLLMGEFKTDPNHCYDEAMGNRQCKDFTCGECNACESYTAYQNGEYK